MQGTVLTFHPETNTGLISGHDGTRYNFSRANWVTPKVEPSEKLTVDFDVDGKNAIQIIVIEPPSNGRPRKKKTTAIPWCLFLGGIGAHKFYLGRPGWGIIYWIFCWTFIPALAAIIELILLLLMSEADFNRKYNL